MVYQDLQATMVLKDNRDPMVPRGPLVSMVDLVFLVSRGLQDSQAQEDNQDLTETPGQLDLWGLQERQDLTACQGPQEP